MRNGSKFALIVSFSAMIAAAAGVPAGDINVYRDSQGRSVYVSSDDPELNKLAKLRGADAARQVIEHRRQDLARIDEFIENVALDQRLDPRLIRAIIEVESAWNVRARSGKGALGLMQLMPETARRFGVRDPFDARENIQAGGRYLRFLLDRFHENLEYSLAAYNAGEKAVDRWGNVPPYQETKQYLQRIAMIYDAMQQQLTLRDSRIMRTTQTGRVVYTNVD